MSFIDGNKSAARSLVVSVPYSCGFDTNLDTANSSKYNNFVSFKNLFFPM